MPVYTDDSGPVAGRVMRLRQVGPDGLYDTLDDVLLTTTTDSNGDYAFNNLLPGSYRITADPPGPSREFHGVYTWACVALYDLSDWYWATPVVGSIDVNLGAGQQLTDRDFIVANEKDEQVAC